MEKQHQQQFLKASTAPDKQHQKQWTKNTNNTKNIKFNPLIATPAIQDKHYQQHLTTTPTALFAAKYTM